MTVWISALATAALVAAVPAEPSDLSGRWEGALAVSGVSLRIVVRVERQGDVLQAVMDSPDQHASGIPVADLTEAGGVVRFTVPAARGRFEGARSPDGDILTGNWSQGGAGLPLILTRVSRTAIVAAPAVTPTLVRPQNPVPPFPYRSEAVAFENSGAGVRLAGTLTLPEGPGPFPAAVLITGSGPQDRDETVFGHKPFLVLADALTRRGIAVLRYDDRGVGGSTGDFGAATSQDFATDAEAAFAFLASRADIDHGRIGLIGHSEGGAIAPIVANAEQSAAWVVMIAGPAVPGGTLITEQVRQIARAQGASVEQADAAADRQQVLMTAVAAHADDGPATENALRPLLEQSGMDPAQAAASARGLSSPWYRWFVAHDPAPDLERMSAPLLALYGGKDVQVPAALNAAALKRLAPAAEVVVLPGLNHLMQPAGTGLPAEYQGIETTLAPEALTLIADWTAARSGPAAKP